MAVTVIATVHRSHVNLCCQTKLLGSEYDFFCHSS